MFPRETYEKIAMFKSTVLLSFDEISELDLASTAVIKKYLTGNIDSAATIKIQSIIDYMYEQVNIGNWKDVETFLRKTITVASYLQVLAILYNRESSENVIKDVFAAIDFGILFGCPLDKEQRLLQNCATILNSYIKQDDNNENFDIDQGNRKDDLNRTISQDIINVPCVDCPSMETFYTKYIVAEEPVVLGECMVHWPALNKWKDNNYFIKLAGLRTVSIEIGKEYTDSNWTQKLITIKDFIKDYIYQNNGPLGYLAQYQLFDQIPELKDDIIEPEYCCFSETNEPVNIMAWYGPKGTVSPLHHDPTKNLLAQVVGEKKIYLFPPSDSEYLYPHEHELLNNTARVDPRNPDFDMYPKFRNAKAYFCILKPGQMLYIPPKWWHFVESLSVSFSVSFWWQ